MALSKEDIRNIVDSWRGASYLTEADEDDLVRRLWAAIELEEAQDADRRAVRLNKDSSAQRWLPSPGAR